jgi:signal transduction histidine kinase
MNATRNDNGFLRPAAGGKAGTTDAPPRLAPPEARSACAVRAHEIKNCLAVATAVNCLTARIVDASTRERIARAQAALRRILSIVQTDVLSPTDELQSPSCATVDSLIGDVVDRVADRAELGGVNLVVRCDLGAIEGDLPALAEALTNLVLNAIQVTPRGGVVLIGTRLGPDGSQSLTVQDTGPGMSTSRVAQLGKACGSRRRGGWGVGFAVARQTIEDHGGMVNVDSVPGSGTVVAIWLPPPCSDVETRPLSAVGGGRP